MLNFQVFRETNPLGLCFQVACRWQTHHFSRSNWNTQFVDTACSTKVGQWNTQFVWRYSLSYQSWSIENPLHICAQTLGMRDFQITCRSQTHNFSCSILNTQFVKYSISYQTWGMKHHSLMKIIMNCPDWNHIK